MTRNEELYNKFKKLVKGSPFFCKNLPTANRSSCKCDKCGKYYDYRYAPMVTDETWQKFGIGVKFLCADCMEKVNGGRMGIKQLSTSLMSVNYLFCNDLPIENDEETYNKLNEFIDYVQYKIETNS